MLATQTGDLNSLFFKLPLEIRYMIYEYLWASQIVSLKQSRNKLRLVAYRNETAHHKSNCDRDLFAEFQNSQTRFRSCEQKPGAPLPDWLLVSKIFLREAIAIFIKDAHYVLSTFMSSSTISDTALHSLTIMLPGLPRSLTVGPLTFLYTKVDFNGVTNATSAHVHCAASSAEWLANLAKCLENQNIVQNICVAIQYPYLEEGPHKQVVCVDLKQLKAFLEVLKGLKSLELVFLDLTEQQSVRYDVQTASLRLAQAVWGPHVMVAEGPSGEHRRYKFTR